MWDTIGQIGSILTGLGSFAAVIVALWLARRSKTDLWVDRILRYQPTVVFDPGPVTVSVKFAAFHHRIAGLDPNYVAETFSNLKPDTMVADLDGPRHYGNLVNHGQGPAFGVQVTWVARVLHVGSDRFVIDYRKSNENRYMADTNTMPSVPHNLAMGASGQLTRIPVIWAMDSSKSISEIEAEVHIKCTDLYGNTIVNVQEVRIFPNYDKPASTITFGSIVSMGDIET